jgi:hypothetical protein
MLESGDLSVEQDRKRERMSRPVGPKGQGRERRLRWKLVVKVINHCERIDAKVDDTLQGVIEIEGTRLHEIEVLEYEICVLILPLTIPLSPNHRPKPPSEHLNLDRESLQKKTLG